MFYKHLCHSLIKQVSDPFPHNLQYTINPKPLEQGTQIFYYMFTTCHMSRVMCHVSSVICNLSHVMCQKKYDFFFFFFGKIGLASWRRVCYQWGLPRLVLIILEMHNMMKCFSN